jgi:hypothetical protein
MTPLVGNRGVIVSVHDVCVRNTRLPFLANLVHYQCDFSAIRENNRDLSITRGYPHVMLWERSVGWGGGWRIQINAIVVFWTTKCMIQCDLHGVVIIN